MRQRTINSLPIILVWVLIVLSTKAHAQNNRILTLEEVIEIAREQSPDALAARHTFRGSYWQYRSFKASYLPGLNLDATLPNFNRNIQAITLPDGTDSFVRRNLSSS